MYELRFWRGGHCRSIFTPVGVVFCSAVFRPACAYFCRHACGRNQLLLPFLLHSFNCVCARARPRATVCVPLKSCGCKRRTERLLRFPKTFLPLGERGSPHCPSSCGSLPVLHSLFVGMPPLWLLVIRGEGARVGRLDGTYKDCLLARKGERQGRP